MDHPLSGAPEAGLSGRAEASALPEGWRGDWSGLRVAVLGLDAEGFAAADTLAELGAQLLVLGSAPDEDRERVLAVLGVPVLVAAQAAERAAALAAHRPELVVASSAAAEEDLRSASALGVPLWGEADLAWRLRDKAVRAGAAGPAPWLLVTAGSPRVASAVVDLAALLLEAGELRVAPCGAAGGPVLDAVRDPEGFDVLLVELSPSRLALLQEQVRPWASACAGGADAEAGRLLARVYRNTEAACLYDRGDARTEDYVREAEVVEGARAIGVGLDAPGPSELGVVDGILCDRAFLAERAHSALELCTLGELAASGRPVDPGSVAVVLFASALARSAGVPAAAIHAVLSS